MFGNRDYGNAYRLTQQIVESGIDALFCETDLIAYGVLQGLYEAKVAVPDRLAVLGFDNTKFVNYESQVHLSTIGQPLDAMAEYTAKAIVNKIERNQDYAKLDIENPIIRINTAFKGCSSLEKISVLPRIYHN
ncbi:MAG: substrate-binding domain-containing protein [Lachnospiraceae bacterium]